MNPTLWRQERDAAYRRARSLGTIEAALSVLIVLAAPFIVGALTAPVWGYTVALGYGLTGSILHMRRIR